MESGDPTPIWFKSVMAVAVFAYFTMPHGHNGDRWQHHMYSFMNSNARIKGASQTGFISFIR